MVNMTYMHACSSLETAAAGVRRVRPSDVSRKFELPWEQMEVGHDPHTFTNQEYLLC
jgi:hypothetical protein